MTTCLCVLPLCGHFCYLDGTDCCQYNRSRVASLIMHARLLISSQGNEGQIFSNPRVVVHNDLSSNDLTKSANLNKQTSKI